jgi:hypothetical protein
VSPRPASFLAALAAALALAAAAPATRAALPAASRGFETEDFSRTRASLRALAARRHVALGVAVGEFLHGGGGGTWNPANRTGSLWGARIDAVARRGRWTVGADATHDGALDADPGEHAQRLHADLHLPEAFVALSGAVGFERDGYAATDIEAEAAPIRWPLGLRSADVVPRIQLWARYRHPDTGGDVLTPVVGVALRHLPALGSQVPLALSVRSDLADGAAPVTSGLLQVGYASVPRPLWGGGGDPDLPPAPGDRPPSKTDRSFFVAAGYAFPLDARSSARLLVQAGMRFVRPYGRP